MSGRPRDDEATPDRRQEPRLDGLVILISKLAFLTPGFLWEGRYWLQN